MDRGPPPKGLGSSSRGVFQQAGSFPTATLRVPFGQSLKDALPEAGGAPAPIALVRRFPLAALLGHRAPRGPRAHHPQDAGEHGPVVMARSPGRWLLGRQQRLRPGATRRRSAPPRPLADGGAARARGRAAWRDVRRTAWQRAATAWWARRHRDQPSRNDRRSAASPIASDQPAHLRHREGDQVGIGAPFCPHSSCRAAWRRTTR